MDARAFIAEPLASPRARRWLMAGGGVIALHAAILAWMASQAPQAWRVVIAERPVQPIFMELTPRARPPRALADTAPSSRNISDMPPIVIRPARPGAAAEVAPLVTDLPLAGVRPTERARVIPQSWRDRCGLGEGEVSDSALRACRQSFLQAAAPRDAAPPRSDPRDGWAARSAANVARYEYFRSPAPTGGGNAGPSSTPGSNFGMGEMDDSVIYSRGSRPEVNGGID